MFSFDSPKTLDEQVDYLAAAMLAIKGGSVEVTIDIDIHDDVPDDFVKVETPVQNGRDRYEKTVRAEGGMVTKKIILTVPQ